MKVLVTGNKGFIGKKLSEYLLDKKIIVRDCVDDLFEINEKKISVDIVIHLAAEISSSSFKSSPFESYKSNIYAVNSLLDLCRKNNAKMIFASTCGVYKKKSKRVNEYDELAPENSYSMSKYIGELLCKRYSLDFNLPVTILRFFNVYGFGQSNEFLIPYIFNSIIENKSLNLNTPYELRDFVFVDDVCKAIVKAVENNTDTYEIFNVGSGEVNQVSSVARSIYALFGKDLPEQDIYHQNYICADLNLIKIKLNWEPEISLYEGLEKIAKEYKKNRSKTFY